MSTEARKESGALFSARDRGLAASSRDVLPGEALEAGSNPPFLLPTPPPPFPPASHFSLHHGFLVRSPPPVPPSCPALEPRASQPLPTLPPVERHHPARVVDRPGNFLGGGGRGKKKRKKAKGSHEHALPQSDVHEGARARITQQRKAEEARNKGQPTPGPVQPVKAVNPRPQTLRHPFIKG
jgi:hypothetical protein